MFTAKSAEVFFQAGSTAEDKKHVVQAVLWMFQRYEQLLQRERRMDFDDQKLRAVRCLQAAQVLLLSFKNDTTKLSSMSSKTLMN